MGKSYLRGTVLIWYMTLMCVSVVEAADQKLFTSGDVVDIPDGLQENATTYSDCSNVIRCSGRCQTDLSCKSAIYNSKSSTCMVYKYTVKNLVQSSTKSHLKYLEKDSASNKGEETTNVPEFPVGYEDCQGFYDNGYNEPGVYTLDMPGLELFEVWCDFDASNGWTVIQRRQDGSVDFALDWADYKNGFGNLDGEHWLGNDKIHALTLTNQKLHIYLEAADGTYRNGYWETFYISDETDNYRLSINTVGYTGDAENEFAWAHNGMKFGTRDRDNDHAYGQNCASGAAGGWWYNKCFTVRLNGGYLSDDTVIPFGFGILWCCNWKHPKYDSLVKTSMAVSRN